MKSKFILSLIPEIYLVLATFYYWSLTSNLFNPIAIVLLIILGYLILKQHTVLGLVTSATVLILNLFLILALLSELRDVTLASVNANELVLYGSLFIGLNILLSSFMLIKFLKRSVKTKVTLV